MGKKHTACINGTPKLTPATRLERAIEKRGRLTPKQLVSFLAHAHGFDYWLWWRAVDYTIWRISQGETPRIPHDCGTAFSAAFEAKRKAAIAAAMEVADRKGTIAAYDRYGSLLSWAWDDEAIQRREAREAAQVEAPDYRVMTIEHAETGFIEYRCGDDLQLFDDGKDGLTINALPEDHNLASLRDLHARLGALISAIEEDYR